MVWTSVHSIFGIFGLQYSLPGDVSKNISVVLGFNASYNYSYGHLLVITGYKWDYKFYKWGYKYL